MIISDRRKKMFCHIPKNGGSALRAHFLTQWPDARQYQGRRTVLRANGELRDLTHITPQEAKTYFDDDLIEQGYMTTAIIRAPLPRFSSALLQHIRSFGGGDKHFVTAQTITAYVAQSQIRDLCEAAATDMRCIHFRRQSDFLEGIPAEARALVLMQDLSTRFPALPIENRGGHLPKWAKLAKHPSLSWFARSLGRTAKTVLLRRLVRTDPDVAEALADVLARNRAFVEDFYASDQALYDRLTSERDAA